MSSFHNRVRIKRKIQQRRIVSCFCVALFIFVVSLSAYFILQFEPVHRSYFYVYPYHDTVMKYASMYRVDSNLTAAVIKNESKFRREVHSHRGAVGLMQLMPDTAKWIAGQLGDTEYSEQGLHEPDRNIRYGTWYLSTLQKEFYGNDVLALAAYNAGRGNVQEWIKEKDWPKDFSDIDAIPFEETRDYVRQVLTDQKKYRELYPD